MTMDDLQASINAAVQEFGNDFLKKGLGFVLVVVDTNSSYLACQTNLNMVQSAALLKEAAETYGDDPKVFQLIQRAEGGSNDRS